MLHDFDKTLEKLILAEGNLNKDEIEISFDPPTSEWSARLSRPTINCWCFDLRENLRLRMPDRNVTRNGDLARISTPVKRMDVTYLITAWARKIEDEHQLLWRALGALKRYNALEPQQCEGGLRYQEFSIPLLVGDVSTLQTNLVDLWSVLDNHMHLGFVLITTLEIDPRFGFDTPLVLEGEIRFGTKDSPETGGIAQPMGNVKLKPKPEGEEEKGKKE